VQQQAHLPSVSLGGFARPRLPRAPPVPATSTESWLAVPPVLVLVLGRGWSSLLPPPAPPPTLVASAGGRPRGAAGAAATSCSSSSRSSSDGGGAKPEGFR
jgi:hypothetical protein